MAEGRYWRERAWDTKAGQIAEGRVDDASGKVTEAWTGPQVAWGMARGSPGAFGGKQINSLPIWLGFCALFFVGLGDLRRPLSLRNLDLLALLSFSVSLWFFNQGRVFSSASLVYPPLFYLFGRLLYIGIRGRPTRASRPVWPVWLLAAVTVFAIGFRIGLNIRDGNVIDVGYAGVIGADRIVSGESPYGHFPVETLNGKTLKACGPADSAGNIHDRIQPNGRCESVNPEGDTYGPVAYLVYIPGLEFFGWSHKWNDLPAVHFTTILFDLLCIGGLVLVGRRFGGTRLAVTLAFAWAAYPFTQYVSSSNTNDAIAPAFLIWGFWLASSPWARGVAVALSSWTKFSSLIVAPLWATYPDALRLRSLGKPLRFVAAFLVTSIAASVGARLGSQSEASDLHLLEQDLPPPARSPVAVLALGLAPVPRRRITQSASRSDRPDRRRADARDRQRLLPATALAPAACGLERRVAGGVRARADVLVLHLYRLVLPVCRYRFAGRCQRHRSGKEGR